MFAASRFVTLRNPSLTAGVIVVFALALVALHPDSLQSSPLTGPFGYANATAAFLVLAGTATAVLARHTRSRPLSAALLMVALAVAATSFLIGSVAAVVSAVVLAVGTIASFASPRIRRGAVVVGITAVLCAQVGTALLGSMCLADECTVPRPVATALSWNRVLLWADALRLVGEQPLTGVGPGRFAEVSPTARSDADLDHAHNEVLELAAELGLPGLALGAGLIALAWIGLLKAASRPETVIVAAGITGLLLQSAVDYPLHFPVIVLTATALLGTAIEKRPRTQ